jgi:signal peptidase II
MSQTSRNTRVFWITAVIVVACDFVAKTLAVLELPEHIPHEIIGDAVRFTLAYNPGAAFSMSLGAFSRVIFGAFAVIALIIIWWLYRASKPGETLRTFSLGLVWGGAAGNLFDRFRSPRGVVDFIDIGYHDVWRFWTFNVADSAVTVGAILLAWVLWNEDRVRAAAHPEAAAVESPELEAIQMASSEQEPGSPAA